MGIEDRLLEVEQLMQMSLFLEFPLFEHVIKAIYYCNSNFQIAHGFVGLMDPTSFAIYSAIIY